MKAVLGGAQARRQHPKLTARRQRTYARQSTSRIVTMLTMLFLVFSLFGPLTVEPAIAQEGTPVAEADPVVEQPAAQEPIVTEPITEPAAAEQPAPEAAAAEAPAQEQQGAIEQVVEQPAAEEAAVEEPVVDETSGVFADVAAEPVVVEEAPVSCVQAEGVSPWIASDLVDYPPGALVTLSGGNWVAGQTVEIFVDDDGVADAEMGEWSLFDVVVADGGGNIYYQFTLPNWFVADYYVTATGECSAASTTFTDGNVQVNVSGVSFATFNYAKFNSSASCAGTPNETSTMASGTAKGANDGQSLQFTAPSIPGYTFQGWTGVANGTSSTICVAGVTAGGARILTATYAPAVVEKQNQTITFAALGNKTYGDAPFTVSATASSGLTVSFAASGNCTISGTTVTITGAGSCTLTASQAGDTNYNAATNAVQNVSIAKAQLRVDGFYQPIDMGVINSTKGGSTVPVKFEVFEGGVELTDTSKFQVTVAKTPGCGVDASGTVPLEQTTTGNTSLRYDSQSGQFIYNLKTDKAAGTCYTVSVTPVDPNNVELTQPRTVKIVTK